jgi:hypothetical protein
MLASVVALGLCAGTAMAQTAMMPPHANNFTGNTRGYWFTAPVSFVMTGVQALQAPGGTNTVQSWAVVRFDNNTPPPNFSATTNAFQQLAIGLSQPAGVFSPVNIAINAGDVIGIYGVTGAAGGAVTTNSYTAAATQATTTIFGNSVDLFRSGMQFQINTVGMMQNLWAEPGSTQISRVEFTYVPAPTSLSLLGVAGLLALRRRR